MKLFKIFLLFLLVANLGFAQEKTWSAQWIWTSDQGPNNAWVNIRKKVILQEKPSTAITSIAAENKYWLYINGKLVVRDGGLDARPDLQNTYYDELDLAPYLKKGENSICALVWHKGGPEGYTQRTLPDGGFLFESKLAGRKNSTIVSDKTWKIQINSAFENGLLLYKFGVNGTIQFSDATFGGDAARGFVKSGFYRKAGSTSPFIRCSNENTSFNLPGLCDVAYGVMAEPMKPAGDHKWLAYPVTYDARKETADWFSSKFNDASWSNAVAKGLPPTAPWNKLVKRSIPFWKDYGLTAYTNQPSILTTINRDTVIAGNLGINIQGTPYLKLNAPAGVHIRIVLNDFYYQDYITKAGLQEFECFAWQNSSSQTVKYQFTNVTGPVKILDLKFRQTSYNTEILGSFTSNDTALNTLWTKCKNTSRVCMRDYFYDCPNRERGQWWGDVSEQILYSFYLYDNSSIKLAQKAFRELFSTQKPDGSLYTTAPGKAFNLPDQNMAAVAMLWNYYLYTGDKTLLEELYPYAKKFVQQCASTANTDGILIMQPGQGWKLWNWIDWGTNMDIQEGSANTVCNALYIALLENSMKMADALKMNEDISYYKALQTKAKEHFNAYFWNGSAYAFHTKNGVQSTTVDDRSGAWAVLAGMVDADKIPLVLKTLQTRNDASPYQEMYIEQAMLQLNPTETLIRMRSRFSDMIKSWSSTLWEEFPATNSNNHAWSAGPMYLLSAYYLGIKPLTPGFNDYVFFPMMGNLKQISGVVPSPKGNISASIQIDSTKKTFIQKLTSPANTVCVLGIPKQVFGQNAAITSIKVGSKTVWEKGVAVEKIAGVSFYKEDDQYIQFKVQSGSWVFTSQTKVSVDTQTSNELNPEKKNPKILNIVNFIREVEPRDPLITKEVLYQTVVKQVEMMKKYQLGGTFLLQYDALIDPKYQQLLKELPQGSFEIGGWWEIPQPLVEKAGLKWRGRYSWDWHADIGFSTGYSPEEREKLTDVYMNDFKNIFGYYPKSVGSWFIDAHTLNYMYEKYHIVASCNCKDQYGTDGYTLWGGYWNQAYYPSRINSYMPAQTEKNQLPVPIFRMLGSDPVRQYDSGLGSNGQGVVTLEPVYPQAGGDSAWVNWFLKEFVDGECMEFAYTQAGQENSFTWNAMAKGFEIQMPLIARLRNENKLTTQTLAESGQWFKNHYKVTPATSVTVNEDLNGSNLKTVWFNSRYYRVNILWENNTLRFRDIHLFNENFPSMYTTQKATSNQVAFFTLPFVDGYLWSSAETLAGLRLKALINGKETLLEGSAPIVTNKVPGKLHIVWPLKSVDGSFTIDMDEEQIKMNLVSTEKVNWFLDMTASNKANLPFMTITSSQVESQFEGMYYSVSATKGQFSTPDKNTIFRLTPDKNNVILNFVKQ